MLEQRLQQVGEGVAIFVVALALHGLADAGDLGPQLRLLDLPEDDVDAAAIDGLWQLLILAGTVRDSQLRAEVLSYEAPPEYATGMIVAVFERQHAKRAPQKRGRRPAAGARCAQLLLCSLIS